MRHVTTALLAWVCERLARERKRVRVLIWDKASWHISRAVRTGMRQPNQRATRAGGVRVLACRWPSKSPWLNPIEPRGVHSQRAIVAPVSLLTAAEVSACVGDYCQVDHLEPLKQQVA